MADERKDFARALAKASQKPAEEYAQGLAESVRGANQMRQGVIDRVAESARTGRPIDHEIINKVTTLAFIDRACAKPPVRLVYSRADDDGCGVPGEGEI